MSVDARLSSIKAVEEERWLEFYRSSAEFRRKNRQERGRRRVSPNESPTPADFVDKLMGDGVFDGGLVV